MNLTSTCLKFIRNCPPDVSGDHQWIAATALSLTSHIDDRDQISERFLTCFRLRSPPLDYSQAGNWSTSHLHQFTKPANSSQSNH
jgi:hypothetical protein